MSSQKFLVKDGFSQNKQASQYFDKLTILDLWQVSEDPQAYSSLVLKTESHVGPFIPDE